MKKILLLTVLLALAISIIAGCSNELNNKEAYKDVRDEKLQIYTTFYPVYYIAGEIAGDKAHIIEMIPSGVDPHNWEPTLKTMAELKESNIFIYNGAGMERWAEKIIKDLEESKVKAVEASQGIELIVGESDHNEDYDPHTWVSPMNLKKQAKNVLDGLIEIDEDNEEYYKVNYENLSNRLDKLDSDIREAAKAFSVKTIVTSHEAFGYFAKEYGLEQIPIRGISPEQEPSPAKLAEIIKMCKEYNIKHVFVEKFISPKFSQLIADEIAGEVLSLNVAHGLTQEEKDQGQDYISIMYENLKNLEKALK